MREGFRLTSLGSEFTRVEEENYASIYTPENRNKVAKQVNVEVANSRYVVTNENPPSSVHWGLSARRAARSESSTTVATP